MLKHMKQKKMKKMIANYAALYSGFFTALGESVKMEVSRVENKNLKGFGNDVITHFEIAGFTYNNPKGLK